MLVTTPDPPAASFHGYPVKIKVVKNESKKEDFVVVDAHTNESVGSVKRKIAEAVKQPEDQISLSFGEVSLDGAGKQVSHSLFISPTKSAKQSVD